jgi:L-lactate dehydrogenase (cytochrome)
VQGDIKILFDSGIRTGLDIVRAIASGADAVVIGRAWVYGLAAQKKQGVTNVVDILGNELRVAMALSGCSSLKQVTRDILVKQ